MNEWCRKKPLEWQEYVNKEVKVNAAEQEYKGWVFTVDPVSANIVLVNLKDGGKASVMAVMGHAVEAVEVLRKGDSSMTDQLTSLFMPAGAQSYSREELENRKSCLRDWLEKNRIPFTEQGAQQETLCVAGVLTVNPPYGPEDCSSSNEIILSRVQHLIQSNPGCQQDQ